ncbi:hypothetical protein NCAS_0D04850 [Naumovozyma castellii]|uniref:NAD-dependent epimerase/dehydratase domain-containing protein n=1 Tax=Naumovozyma castellii TaxID=27288 RepID=G0VES5_NAUCA|nr:hypothetical protein NCAS_0D04850 [Naumovozyma castellii CBS 4309]CCC70066.1 hypothetical protein NCAS_0D04850 [Naumovozyma castellii CBS 4309]
MEQINKNAILVSGADGFIALHIVNDLLQKGYTVIGSVRNPEEAALLMKDFNNNPKLIPVVVEDISKLNSFDHVFQEYGSQIKGVLHVASPVHFESSDVVNDLLIPALNGTTAVLNAIKEYAPQSVEKVVITSSFAGFVSPKQMADKNTVVTEDSWNDSTWENCQSDPISAYCASKKFAEKAAWDFLEKYKSEVKFELAVISPGWVFGPQLFSRGVKPVMNVSCEIINKIVHARSIDDVPFEMMGPYIDVRDTAKAHIFALENDSCNGHRLILNEGFFTAQEILDIVHNDFPEVGKDIPMGNPGTGKKLLEERFTADNSKTRKILGFPFRDLKETVDDTVAQIIEVNGKK